MDQRGAVERETLGKEDGCCVKAAQSLSGGSVTVTVGGEGETIPVPPANSHPSSLKDSAGKCRVMTGVLVSVGVVGLLVAVSLQTSGAVQHFQLPSPWMYRCVEGRCVKEDYNGVDDLLPFTTCKLTCGPYGVLWPQPSNATLGKEVVQFLPQRVYKNATCVAEVCSLLDTAFKIFHDNLEKYHPDYSQGSAPWTGPWDPATLAHVLQVNINVAEADTRLTLHTDESYRLQVTTVGPLTTATLTAKTFFGARHGLETLSQLVEYHETNDALLMVSSASISDAPAFKYRGLLLDTSRNYYSVAALERTLDAMATNKLNTLHWHITDTHSFPLYLDSLPQLSYYGAYSPRQLYYPADVRHLVDYARVRGIRVLPELDAPAHVGNGWQFGEKEGLGKLAVCVNQEPWQSYCVEPPCGQLNLANPRMYDVLRKIYEEMVQIFSPVDLFHFGGDEVNLNCWNSTEEISNWMTANNHSLDEASYYDQWAVFQEKSRQLLMEANGGQDIPGILWTSHLTDLERLEKYLNNKYIVQIWTTGEDQTINNLLNLNYSVIFSNYDALYLDCGMGAWVGEGNNWCSPYKGWQTVYDNSPHEIANQLTGSRHEQLILGGEAPLWSEQADEASLDAKLWPRGAALAERLWTNPSTGWEAAETRMVHHRQRMVSRGVGAERLQPQWCHQNEGLCYL